jgi:uncharacterized repeat protein (TIGR01451 family)
MKNLKVLLTAFLLTAALLVPVKVLADQYGEVEVSKDITIDKKVKNPNTGDFVDNLFASDFLFKQDQEVEFKVVVKNVGDKDLDKVEYRDTLPSELDYVDGALEASISDFKVNEEKTFFFKTKADIFGKDAGTYCTVNTAYAWIEGGESEKDTAQVCITKGEVKGFVAEKLPQAGPGASTILLFGSTSMALAGWALTKKK